MTGRSSGNWIRSQQNSEDCSVSSLKSRGHATNITGEKDNLRYCIMRINQISGEYYQGCIPSTDVDLNN